MPKILLSICILFILNFVVSAQNPQGFYLDDWQAKTIESPEYVNTPQPTKPDRIKVMVYFTDTIAKVSKYIYGNNAINWAGKMNNNAGLMKHVTNLQPNVLRWPGGNLSNEYFWDASSSKHPQDIPPTLNVGVLQTGMSNAGWSMNVSDYYDELDKTNSTGCICVNYSYARYGTSADPVAIAAHYAAEWVRYDNGRTKLWEIGNENMGPWEAGYEIDTSLNQDGQPKTITGDLYGKHSRVFIDSMKAAAAEIGSEIKIGVGLTEANVTWNDVMKNWNSGVLPHVSDKADFLIVHSYYTPYDENSSIATILNSPKHTKGYKDYVLNDLKEYGNKDNLPIALTEWNIFAVGNKQCVSYINGMHATLNMGELIKNEFGQANRWDLMNGWGGGDDHGTFASDAPGMSYGEPYAPYFYMYYFQKYFGDHMVNSTVNGNTSIESYASAFSSGQSSVVLVNKREVAKTISLQMNNFPDAKSYYRHVLTGGTDNGDFSRKVFVNENGPSPNKDGGGPLNYETIPAYGTAINNDGDINIELPPLSVTYVLVGSESIPPITSVKSIQNNSLEVYPNPSNGEITINSPDFAYEKIEVINLTGKKVFEEMIDFPSKGIKQINLNLNTGMYILNLSKANQKISKKLIVR